MKSILFLLITIVVACSSQDDVGQNIKIMMSSTNAKSRVDACVRLAIYKEPRVIASLVASLNDRVVKGCATRSLVLIDTTESLSYLLEFMKNSDVDTTIFKIAIRFGDGEFLSDIRKILIGYKSRKDITASENIVIDTLLKELQLKAK